jgi:hypothetical protein
MAGGLKSRVDRLRLELNRSTAFLNTKWPRRVATTLIVIVVLFGLFGFFGVPMILRHVLTTQVATSISRPVTVGRIAFNPYRLRLELDQLHIADRDPQKPFVDLGHLRVKLSWTSLFRLAPVVKELIIDRPAFHLVRTGDQQFNFSDLLVTKTPPPPPSKPQRFALSNIRIRNGDVRFDDQVLSEQHAVEHLDLDVPFIANLPADTQIFVQPLLRMVVDGSPIKIGGRALPFAPQPESAIGLSINHFNLAPYMGYVPTKLPIKIPAGALSAFLQLHFVQAASGPIVRVTGNTSLDDLDVRDSTNAPLAGFKRATVILDDVEPLGNVFHLGAITLDTLNVVLVRNRDGTTNLTSLTAPPPANAFAPVPSPAAPAPTAALPSPAPGAAAAPIATSSPGAASSDVSQHLSLSRERSARSAPGEGTPRTTAPPVAATPLSNATPPAAAPRPAAPAPVTAAPELSSATTTKPQQSTAASAPPAARTSINPSASPAALPSPAPGVAAAPIAASSPGAASSDASQHLSLSRERSVRSAPGEGTPRSTAPASPATTAATPAAASSSPTPTGLSAPSIAASAPSALPPPSSAPAAQGPLDLSIASVTLTNSAVKLTDNSLATPATVALQNINVGLKQFAMGPKAGPAAYDFAGQLSGGGSIAVKGALDLAQSQVTSDVTITQVDLPPLQAYAQSALAATLGAGKLNAHANVQTSFAASKFNLHVEPADFSVDNLSLNAPGGRDQPVQWSRFGATIAQVDLASHQAVVKEVHADGIRLSVKRSRDGKLSLLSLLRTQNEPAPTSAPPERGKRRRSSRQPQMTVSRGRRAPTRRNRRVAKENAPAAAPAPPAGPQWQYGVESIAIEKAEINGEDDSSSKPIKAAIAPLNLHVKNFTSDFHQPFDVDLDGVLNRRGKFRFNGPVALAPLKATLRVNTQRLDLAFAEAFATKDLNASIKTAMLTTTGVASAATVRDKLKLGYRGDATIGNVRVLDKLTGDDFVRWNALAFNRIDFALGPGRPQLRVGAIALSDFYARVILNANGRLNLSDITSNPEEARKSLTREETGAAPIPSVSPVATPTPTPTPAPPSAAAAPNGTATPAALPTPVPKPLPADIQLGGITLHGGHIDYSDFFIKPNYRANLTNVSGSVGAFGTSSTAPADVLVVGQINSSSPINISGAINPLAPLAAVDIKAKADGIVLTDLTAYSVKYTGYPITKGTLTVDVHYVLDKQILTATNHIFLDQLTFGDRVESSTAKNLPIRLAVAILKDSKGQINLDVPVSGSLNDPQFSLGGIIFHAFMNILTKAITAPFRLLTSAIGGIAGAGGSNEDLSYVEFAPGRATLTDVARKRLDAVAVALNARPALKLSIIGRVDPEIDKAGLHEAKVDDLVIARLKDSEGADAANGTIPADLYDKYLKKVYKAAKFEKPTNAVGLNKSLPPDEMKKLLVTNMPVSDDDLKKLANARAEAVRTYLGMKIDPSRLVVAPSKLDASGITDQGKSTRADLSLQ